MTLGEFEGVEECGWGLIIPHASNFAGVVPVRLKSRTVARAKARVFHDLDFLDSFEGQVRAYMGSLGLTNPAKIVWNALPFSFIVDWFTGISDYLTGLLNLQQQADWLVDRFCSSIVTESKYTHKVVDSNGAFVKHVGSLKSRHYRRFVGLPQYWDLVFNEPSPKQLSLLAAIIAGSNRY
jgi:hypothetical protein